MNFSYEELYYMYGQYDTNITVTFQFQSDSYNKYGASLMGSIIYTEKDREELEAALKADPIKRSERKIRFETSEIQPVTKDQYEELERFGFLCSDIYEINSYNRPRKNRYTERGSKEIENTIVLNVDGWQRKDLNRISFGFLNSRFTKGEALTPNELTNFLGLRAYFGQDNSESPFKELGEGKEKDIRFHELEAKYNDLVIEEADIAEFANLIANRYITREKLIAQEIQKSSEKITDVAERYNDQLKNLKAICHKFEEDVILYGEKLIYLDFERFLHIYARHVTETLIGDRFEGKTVFQYKFDDIIRIIKLVIESESANIREHFKTTPDREFIRRGTRSIYFDGHYYRVQIDTNGRLTAFHPYNNNEDRDADDN